MLNANDASIRGGCECMCKAGLAIGSTATKVKTVEASGSNGVTWSIDGLTYYKANTDDQFTLSGTALAAGEICMFLLGLNASGTATAVQSDIYTTTDIKNGLERIEFPQMTDGYCPIGCVVVETAAGYTFTPGTTELSATGVTDTYVDIKSIPTQGLGSTYCA